ncbi:MAG TPA: tRNA epoxyqueuosine(34) reductase QueG [Pirellulaceae bacterium]|nr:tRNA epoxyqueuosine(34) reductase QueG [Pirellulaceae bacterium]
MPLPPAILTDELRRRARRLGFALVGVCPAVAPSGVSRLNEWLERGYAGEMDYLVARQEAYEHPRHVLDGVRSIVMLGLPYETEAPQQPRAGQGRISRYAFGSGDYHDVIHDKLRLLIAALREIAPGAAARGVVDTAPLLEREFAQLAGLGWIGKHTLLINKPAGSYFFLAALLTDQELIADEPFAADHCGTCRACLDACPTGAFPQPYVLDATRCISYLTIELRGPIPAGLRAGIGDWVFGCDVCQEVCPWNHRPQSASEPAFQPAEDANPVDLIALLELDDEGFRRRFRHTPLWRARRRGILRNAAIVLGNQRADSAAAALIRALEDAEPLVRGAAAWALGRIGGEAARQALAERAALEPAGDVRREIEAALRGE